MLGQPLGTAPLGTLPLTALQEAIFQLQCAIKVAPKDEAAAAEHIELALPYFREALSWGRKAGRKPAPPGGTVGERRLAMLERGISMEDIAEIDGVDVEVVRRSIDRGEKRRRGQ
jgi:hypothetical protein